MAEVHLGLLHLGVAFGEGETDPGVSCRAGPIAARASLSFLVVEVVGLAATSREAGGQAAAPRAALGQFLHLLRTWTPPRGTITCLRWLK